MNSKKLNKKFSLYSMSKTTINSLAFCFLFLKHPIKLEIKFKNYKFFQNYYSEKFLP